MGVNLEFKKYIFSMKVSKKQNNFLNANDGGSSFAFSSYEGPLYGTLIFFKNIFKIFRRKIFLRSMEDNFSLEINTQKSKIFRRSFLDDELHISGVGNK